MKKMRFTFIILTASIMFFPARLFAQVDEWQLAEQFRLKLGIEKLFLTVDNDDNIIITGFFSDTIGIDNNQLVSKGVIDMFIAKFDPNQQLLWFKHAGGSNIDFSKFVTTDVNDNIYIQGLYKGIAVFDDQVLNSRGTYDFFTAKYNNEGELEWVKTKKSQKNPKFKMFNMI